MDVIQRIDDLLKERGWTDYRLSLNSGLSKSTVASIRSRNTVPSIPTLEAICNAFGITLSQFFAEDASLVSLTAEQHEMFRKWVALTPTQKKLVDDLITELREH